MYRSSLFEAICARWFCRLVAVEQVLMASGGDGGGRSDDGTQFPGSARRVNKITDVKDSTMPHVKSPPDKFGQL